VNAPGSFALTEGTTLRQAISLAQGTNYKAALSRAVVYRENASGKREEVHIDIGAVMNGKKDDVLIMANDIIMVPNSRTKTLGGALLKAFGMTTITRMPIP
jgi:protein involved in polysaccharide export with SLBB domain